MANSLQLRLAVARLRRLCALRPSPASELNQQLKTTNARLAEAACLARERAPSRGAGGGQRKAGSIKEFNVKEPLPAAFLQVRKKCD